MRDWLILKYRFRFFFKIFLRITFWFITLLSLILFYRCFFVSNSFIYKKRIELFHLSKTVFNSLNEDICNQFHINGILYSDYLKIQNYVNRYCKDENYNINNLKNDILSDSWIKNINIYKKYPNKLQIKIIEYNPFAIWINQAGEYKLIDEYGDIINIPTDEIKKFNNLVVIVGDNIKSEIYNVFNLLSIYNNVSNNLVKIVRVGNRRWNIILKNGLIAKLPEENKDFFKVWQQLDYIMKTYGNDKELEVIDLRINNKIYLKYRKYIAKEIDLLQ